MINKTEKIFGAPIEGFSMFDNGSDYGMSREKFMNTGNKDKIRKRKNKFQNLYQEYGAKFLYGTFDKEIVESSDEWYGALAIDIVRGIIFEKILLDKSNQLNDDYKSKDALGWDCFKRELKELGDLISQSPPACVYNLREELSLFISSTSKESDKFFKQYTQEVFNSNQNSGGRKIISRLLKENYLESTLQWSKKFIKEGIPRNEIEEVWKTTGVDYKKTLSELALNEVDTKIENLNHSNWFYLDTIFVNCLDKGLKKISKEHQVPYRLLVQRFKEQSGINQEGVDNLYQLGIYLWVESYNGRNLPHGKPTHFSEQLRKKQKVFTKSMNHWIKSFSKVFSLFEKNYSEEKIKQDLISADKGLEKLLN